MRTVQPIRPGGRTPLPRRAPGASFATANFSIFGSGSLPRPIRAPRAGAARETDTGGRGATSEAPEPPQYMYLQKTDLAMASHAPARLPGAGERRELNVYWVPPRAWHPEIGRFWAPTREFLDAETTPRPSPPATTACQKPSGMLPVPMVPRGPGGVAVRARAGPKTANCPTFKCSDCKKNSVTSETHTQFTDRTPTNSTLRCTPQCQ